MLAHALIHLTSGHSRKAEAQSPAHSPRLPSAALGPLKRRSPEIKWGHGQELMRSAPNGPEGQALARFL